MVELIGLGQAPACPKSLKLLLDAKGNPNATDPMTKGEVPLYDPHPLINALKGGGTLMH